MKLWVMRHSHGGAFIPDDPKAERDRPLTAKGKKMAVAVAQAMAAADEIPNIIFASPLERAKQTADIVGGILQVQVNIVDDLAPNRPLEDRLLEFMGHREIKRLMVVAHHDNLEPGLTNLGSQEFDPIAMAEVRRLKIDRKSGDWEERWRVCPSDLGFEDIYE